MWYLFCIYKISEFIYQCVLGWVRLPLTCSRLGLRTIWVLMFAIGRVMGCSLGKLERRYREGTQVTSVAVYPNDFVPSSGNTMKSKRIQKQAATLRKCLPQTSSLRKHISEDVTARVPSSQNAQLKQNPARNITTDRVKQPKDSGSSPKNTTVLNNTHLRVHEIKGPRNNSPLLLHCENEKSIKKYDGTISDIPEPKKLALTENDNYSLKNQQIYSSRIYDSSKETYRKVDQKKEINQKLGVETTDFHKAILSTVSSALLNSNDTISSRTSNENGIPSNKGMTKGKPYERFEKTSIKTSQLQDQKANFVPRKKNLPQTSKVVANYSLKPTLEDFPKTSASGHETTSNVNMSRAIEAQGMINDSSYERFEKTNITRLQRQEEKTMSVPQKEILPQTSKFVANYSSKPTLKDFSETSAPGHESTSNVIMSRAIEAQGMITDSSYEQFEKTNINTSLRQEQKTMSVAQKEILPQTSKDVANYSSKPTLKDFSKTSAPGHESKSNVIMSRAIEAKGIKKDSSYKQFEKTNIISSQIQEQKTKFVPREEILPQTSKFVANYSSKPTLKDFSETSAPGYESTSNLIMSIEAQGVIKGSSYEQFEKTNINSSLRQEQKTMSVAQKEILPQTSKDVANYSSKPTLKDFSKTSAPGHESTSNVIMSRAIEAQGMIKDSSYEQFEKTNINTSLRQEQQTMSVAQKEILPQTSKDVANYSSKPTLKDFSKTSASGHETTSNVNMSRAIEAQGMIEDSSYKQLKNTNITTSQIQEQKTMSVPRKEILQLTSKVDANFSSKPPLEDFSKTRASRHEHTSRVDLSKSMDAKKMTKDLSYQQLEKSNIITSEIPKQKSKCVLQEEILTQTSKVDANFSSKPMFKDFSKTSDNNDPASKVNISHSIEAKEMREDSSYDDFETTSQKPKETSKVVNFSSRPPLRDFSETSASGRESTPTSKIDMSKSIEAMLNRIDPPKQEIRIKSTTADSLRINYLRNTKPLVVPHENITPEKLYLEKNTRSNVELGLKLPMNSNKPHRDSNYSSPSKTHQIEKLESAKSKNNPTQPIASSENSTGKNSQYPFCTATTEGILPRKIHPDASLKINDTYPSNQYQYQDDSRGIIKEKNHPEDELVHNHSNKITTIKSRQINENIPLDRNMSTCSSSDDKSKLSSSYLHSPSSFYYQDEAKFVEHEINDKIDESHPKASCVSFLSSDRDEDKHQAPEVTDSIQNKKKISVTIFKSTSTTDYENKECQNSVASKSLIINYGNSRSRAIAGETTELKEGIMSGRLGYEDSKNSDISKRLPINYRNSHPRSIAEETTELKKGTLKKYFSIASIDNCIQPTSQTSHIYKLPSHQADDMKSFEQNFLDKNSSSSMNYRDSTELEESRNLKATLTMLQNHFSGVNITYAPTLESAKVLDPSNILRQDEYMKSKFGVTTKAKSPTFNDKNDTFNTWARTRYTSVLNNEAGNTEQESRILSDQYGDNKLPFKGNLMSQFPLSSMIHSSTGTAALPSSTGLDYTPELVTSHQDEIKEIASSKFDSARNVAHQNEKSDLVSKQKFELESTYAPMKKVNSFIICQMTNQKEENSETLDLSICMKSSSETKSMSNKETLGTNSTTLILKNSPPATNKSLVNSVNNKSDDITRGTPKDLIDKMTEQPITSEAYKSTIRSLEIIKKRAESFEKEIKNFTLLDDTNEHYYIDESLKKLIDKLDDMFDDISNVEALKIERKKVFQYIFSLFDMLDEKVQENKMKMKK